MPSSSCTVTSAFVAGRVRPCVPSLDTQLAAYRGGMDIQELLSKVTNDLTVKRVFGDPIEHGGILLVPVARVRGGAGGGSSTAEVNEGSGGGGGFDARATGVFVVKDGKVTWQPAVDVTRIAVGGQVVAVVFVLVLRSILRRR